MIDIRQREDVLRVYWEMEGRRCFYHKMESMFIASYPSPSKQRCSKCNKEDVHFGDDCPIPDPIPLSMGDLAFFMRDKCDSYSIQVCLGQILPEKTPLSMANPEQWIEAAVVAWDSKAAEAAGDE